MRRVRLKSVNDFAEWRLAARGLLLRGIRPEEVAWDDPAAAADLFSQPEDRPPDVATRAVGVVPPRFLALAAVAICHSDPMRFGLLYRLLFRLQKDRGLIAARSDPDISRLYRLVADVRRESGRMRAAVEAHRQAGGFAVWVEPGHYVLERTLPHFIRTLGGQWAILTPYRSAAWDGAQLHFGAGARRRDTPGHAATPEAWRACFEAIFGTGRLPPAAAAAGAGTPSRNLEAVSDIAAQGQNTEAGMALHQASGHHLHPHARSAGRDLGPADAEAIRSLADASAAIQGCRRCPLYERATQAVFGQGPRTAEVMFVGEQPGDREDLAGKPFVGPAGGVLDRALDTVGIDRRRVYVTNAVKHFKFEPRGKKRIHQKPNAGEIDACRFWLELERQFVRPKLIVAMGATAVHSLMGRAASITSLRGRKLELPDGSHLMVTVHPSFLLRMPDRDRAAVELGRFEADLRAVRAFIDRRGDEVRHGAPDAA